MNSGRRTTLTVAITTADIRSAIRANYEGSNLNPLTLAIRRAFDCKYLDPFVTTWDRKPDLIVCRSLRYVAGSEASFIKRWEAGDPVAPLSFRLQLDPWGWAQTRNQIVRFHERLCYGCGTRVIPEACACGWKAERICYTCEACFCKSCFPARRRGARGCYRPEDHLSAKAGPYDPVFRHYCPKTAEAVAL